MSKLRTADWELYRSVEQDNDFKAMRELCKTDLFYLLVVACKRIDVDRDWIYDRCREVEENPDEYIDLWSREHYKSTIITFGLTIQNILNDPEQTFGIFSHTRPIAKAFLIQIKREFEQNSFLKELFPDILYEKPQKESPKWSLDEGIIVKRKGNPKEATIEAWGIIDGQPTSKHFKKLVYDDVVTKESVTTPEMIKKTTDAFGLSLNLGTDGGSRRFIGTRYHANDTYRSIIARGTAKPRIYPATDDGKMGGRPVLFSQETFESKIKDMGSYLAACQLLQNPLQDTVMGFNTDWIEHYVGLNPRIKYNYYILNDPASKKKKENDYTVQLVIALGPDQNYYLVDGVRDRMNLTERTKSLFAFVKKYNPLNVGYEEYAMQCDIEHIKYVQEQEGYRFRITALGGSASKNDRIRRLVPKFENHRFYLPYFLKFIDVAGKARELIGEFIQDEYIPFPVGVHDDILDCACRICDEDLQAKFPKEIKRPMNQKPYNPLSLKVQNQQNQYSPLATV